MSPMRADLLLKQRARIHDWTADYTAALVERIDLAKELNRLPLHELHECLATLKPTQRVAAVAVLEAFIRAKKPNKEKPE